MMVIDNRFGIGDVVYLITDADQQVRMVSHLEFHPSNQIIYALTCGTVTTLHYDFEISPVKTYLNA